MINRTADKEIAKSTLRENGNQSGMIGLEILYKMFSAMTVTTLTAAVSSAALLLYFLGMLSFLPYLIQKLSMSGLRFLMGGSGPSITIGAPEIFVMIPLALLFTALAQGVVEMLKAPFGAVRNRYYLYLRKNGVRTKASSLFECFDFFVQFAVVVGSREFQIRWLPLVIQIATIILSYLLLWLSPVVAGLTLFIGLVGACVISVYKRLQLSMMAWIQADHPQMMAPQVTELCKEMTAGHIGDLLVFELSYLGWRILDGISFGMVGLLYATPYYNMAKALVYAELKGQDIALETLQSNIKEGSGLSFGIKPEAFAEKINQLGSRVEQGRQSQSAPAPALVGVAGMYAGSNFPLTPDQPVILGRDGASAQIVFSQGAEKISRRHCEILFNSQTQQYRVTDFSSNGTYVNGNRLPSGSPIKVARGSQIALGNNNNVMKLV